MEIREVNPKPLKLGKKTINASISNQNAKQVILTVPEETQNPLPQRTEYRGVLEAAEYNY